MFWDRKRDTSYLTDHMSLFLKTRGSGDLSGNIASMLTASSIDLSMQVPRYQLKSCSYASLRLSSWDNDARMKAAYLTNPK
jgi:hypothetical protein